MYLVKSGDQSAADGAEVPMMLMAWFSDAASSLAIVAQDLRMVWTNKQAEMLLSRHPELSIKDGRLNVARSERPAVVDALAAIQEGSKRTLVLSGGSRLTAVLVEARRLSFPSEPRFGLAMRWLRRRQVPDIDAIRTLYGLTREEAAITGALLQGQTVSAIAQERGKAESTLRSHIKQCYLKMGVGSREEMFAECAGYLRSR